MTNETGFRLEHNPDTVRGPDIAVVFNAQVPRDFEGSYQALAPAVAAEVASPSEQQAEGGEKIDD